jgi:hypothetical protein
MVQLSHIVKLHALELMNAGPSLEGERKNKSHTLHPEAVDSDEATRDGLWGPAYVTTGTSMYNMSATVTKKPSEFWSQPQTLTNSQPFEGPTSR